MQSWVKLPTRWLRQSNIQLILPTMAWRGDRKSNYIACLMIYIVFVQHARRYTNEDFDDIANEVELPYEDGEVNLSYNDLQEITGLSRVKVSSGIKLLIDYGLISRIGDDNIIGKKARYRLAHCEDRYGWGKLPYRKLYGGGKLRAFQEFHLRKRTELDALKIYLVLIAFRDNQSNSTRISFDKISDYTGVHRSLIKAALSFLVVHNLIQVDKHLNDDSDVRNHNVYRIRHIDPVRHAGTDSNSF